LERIGMRGEIGTHRTPGNQRKWR